MNYAPTSLSFADGIIRGAQSERERILELLDKFVYGTDSWDTAVIHNYTDLLAAIEKEETNED